MTTDRRVAALAALVVALALGGCGVSTSGPPEDVGEPANISGASVNDKATQPDGPAQAGSDVSKLVRLYLMAAAGGDSQAPIRQREFLTGRALAGWREHPDAQPPQLTIIRITAGPEQKAVLSDRTPVDVGYRVVGTLNGQGQVSDPVGDSSVVHDIRFWIKSTDNNTSLRIDEFEGADLPPGLLLSDDALTTYYRPQPIYFWDSTARHLIPDVRYLPLTINRDQRAQKLVQWVLGGPSPLLPGPFAQGPPTGMTTKEGVTNQEGDWHINLSAPTDPVAPEAIQRLYRQLQWSLRGVTSGTPTIELSIEGKEQAIGGAPDDYLHFNLADELDHVKQTSYDVVEAKVVALAGSGPQPSILAAKDNTNVVFAAVNRAGDAMALVRSASNQQRFLQLVREPGGVSVNARLGTSKDMGRPTWIPGTQLVVVPSGGKLYQVQPDGNATEILSRTNITSVSVSPDGRRVAWVEGPGNAYVAPLAPDPTSTSVTIATANPRPVLARQLSAKAVAWSNEAWLYVVGVAGNLWRTTVDSAVAQDLTALIRDVKPTDVVALADGEAQEAGQGLIFTSQGCYTVRLALSSSTLKNPFFVS